MYKDIDIDNVLDIDTDTDIDNNLGGANFWTPPTPDKSYIRSGHVMRDCDGQDQPVIIMGDVRASNQRVV